jgi:hypothetical protein
MKVAKYVLYFCIIFFLASSIWLKIVRISIESQEKNFGDVAGLLIESEILTLLTLMNTLKETGRQGAAPL